MDQGLIFSDFFASVFFFYSLTEKRPKTIEKIVFGFLSTFL
jgi:hypothetical protein